MNTHHEPHLRKNDILLALVDEERLSATKRQHLSVCPHCRSQMETINRNLRKLGETAREAVPMPPRRPTIPGETSRISIFSGITLKPALAAAAAMILLVAVSLWTIVGDKTQVIELTGTHIDIWEEEQLMLEMDLFAENALPGDYVDMISESDIDIEEAFLDYLVPLTDIQPLSLDRITEGGLEC